MKIQLISIFLETLRLYPPGSALVRKCTENYRIEDSNIVLEKGTGVLIPILGLHKDPGYFPDPEEFDPDRFSDENKSKIPTYAYMPFGEGPRVCIGTCSTLFVFIIYHSYIL